MPGPVIGTKSITLCLILVLMLLSFAVAGSPLPVAASAVGAPPAAPAIAAAMAAATATLPANRVEIFQDVNVRAGPGTDYDQVGVLIPGQTSPIIGRNVGGTWFEINYVGGANGVGWVFKDLVHVVGDLNTMPTVVPPPTPTLRPTTTAVPGSTRGPTPAATGSPSGSHLPTFTAPAAVALPTLLPAQGVSSAGAFPPAVLIIVLFVLGAFGILLSLLRLRR